MKNLLFGIDWFFLSPVQPADAGPAARGAPPHNQRLLYIWFTPQLYLIRPSYMICHIINVSSRSRKQSGEKYFSPYCIYLEMCLHFLAKSMHLILNDWWHTRFFLDIYMIYIWGNNQLYNANVIFPLQKVCSFIIKWTLWISSNIAGNQLSCKYGTTDYPSSRWWFVQADVWCLINSVATDWQTRLYHLCHEGKDLAKSNRW